jgi:hypothetical protein
MKLNVYTVYDQAANAYMNPFFMHNDGLAVRAFQDNVNSKEPNNVSLHPDQFTLFRIGEFDDQSAVITYQEPKSLGNGLHLKNPDTEPVDTTAIIERIKQLEAQLKLAIAQTNIK